MQTTVTCPCGHRVTVDPSAGPGACPACGRSLAAGQAGGPTDGVQAPPVAAPPGAPAAMPAWSPPPGPGESKGMAIASMVLGIVSAGLFCFHMLAVLTGTVGVALGVVSLAKKKGGKGMAITGVCTGGVGVLLGLAMLAVPFLIMSAMVGGMAHTMQTMPAAMTQAIRGSVVHGQAVTEPPAVLTPEEMLDAILAPADVHRDARRARVELDRARDQFDRREAYPAARRACVVAFRRHLGHAGLKVPSDPDDARKFRTAAYELHDRFQARYDEACELERDERWDDAADAYRAARRELGGTEAPLLERLSRHIRHCRWRVDNPESPDVDIRPVTP